MGTPIRWPQMRGALGVAMSRAKAFHLQINAPAGRKIALLGVLAALSLTIAVYGFRQRGNAAPIDSPAFSLRAASRPPARVAQAGLDGLAPRADAARPYPRGFLVLLTRSIFAVNGVASKRSAFAVGAATPPSPVSTLSLKGITEEDAQFTAFVEDAAANRIFQVRLGDALGPGRVCGITLHDLTYEVSGSRQRLEIDNISGRSGPAVSAPVQNMPRSDVDGASGQGNAPSKKKKKRSQS
jgi:hypothetical protein